MAQQQQQQQQQMAAAAQMHQPSQPPNGTPLADNIREFYRTPTMLAEDPFFAEDQEHRQQTGYDEEETGVGGGGGGWRATSLDEPSSTSYDVNSLVEDTEPEPQVHHQQHLQQQQQPDLFINEGALDDFTQQRVQDEPLWLPSVQDRRTPTLPWTSSLDADAILDSPTATATPTQATTSSAAAGGRRKSTKKTPAPPPPPVKRIQARKTSSSSSTESLT